MKTAAFRVARSADRGGHSHAVARIGSSFRRGMVVILTLTASLGPTWAQENSGLTVELNKLEEAQDACRAYLVFENKSLSEFASLKLDLVMFGADGVITRRLAVEGGPLPAGKTSVKLFEISALSCTGISRILLNDVISCQDETGEHEDCVERVSTSSLNEVSFFK